MPNSQKIKVSIIEKLTNNPLQGKLQIFNEHKQLIASLPVDNTLTFFSPTEVFQLSPEVENYKIVHRHIQHEDEYRHYIYQFKVLDDLENVGSLALNTEAFLENIETEYEIFLESEPKMFFSSDLLITSEPDTKMYTLGEDFFDLFLIRKKASFHE